MAKFWKGSVEIIDVEKKRLLLRCKEPAQGSVADKESTVVIAWNLTTRVTTADRGLIPIQQLRAGQTIYADCVQDPDGRWLARAIEVIPASAPQGIGTGAKTKGAKGGEEG